MSVLFAASEIVEMAIQIEKNGLNFYRKMAARTKNEKVKSIFLFLVAEEIQHEKTFNKLLKNLPILEMSHTEEAEYNNYLNALTSSRIFNSNVNMDELVKEISDDIEAVDFAIRAEQDAILFYYELKERTRDDGLADVEAIIEEEKMHFSKLSQLKLDLLNNR